VDHFHDHDDDDHHDHDYFHRCTHVLDVIPYGDTYALGIRQQPQKQPQKQQKHHPGYRSLRRTAGSQTPYIVDFCPSPHSRIAKRIQSTSSGSSSDLLIKAVAPHKIKRNEGQGGARIWDLTAGFGQDSLLMLEHGASEVCMVERDPIVAALLQDALRRRERIMTDATTATAAMRTGGHSSSSTKKLSLWVGNGIDMIQSAMAAAAPHHNDEDYHDHHPRLPVDVCYLDPMFPPRTKSAAVKKNMQILHSLLESQQQPPPPTLPIMDNDVNHDDPWHCWKLLDWWLNLVLL
jgi:16S rRNA G966 N2-methylase RsmD